MQSIGIWYFPWPSGGKYYMELFMQSTGIIGTVNLYGRVSGIRSCWDWYVNTANAPVYLYIDGGLVYSGQLNTWGAHGSGLNGVQTSDTVLLASNAAVSKTSTVQFIVDCSIIPKITSGGTQKPMGYNDSGAFTPTWTDVVTFTRPPVMKSLSNENKYNNNSSISASTNSIKVGYTTSTSGDSPTALYYSLNGASWAYTTGNPFEITGLSAGTTYVIHVYGSNEAGSSNSISTTIRTRHNIPTISTEMGEAGIDSFELLWESNRPCQQISYIIREKNPDYGWNDGWSEWVYVDLPSLSSGTLVIEGVEPGKEYEVQACVLSTAAYDSLWSDRSAILDQATLEPAYLSGSFDYIFGENFENEKINPSEKDNFICYYHEDDLENPIVYRNLTNAKNESLSIEPTDSEWDTFYKLLEGVSTSMNIVIRISTETEDGDIYYNEYSGTLTLTGNMKTIHIGCPSMVDRSKGWIEEEGERVRCVSWVGGLDNKPYRCI